MVFIITARSLHHSIITLPLTSQKRLDDTFKAVPVFSFNLKANNRQKTVQYLLNSSPNSILHCKKLRRVRSS